MIHTRTLAFQTYKNNCRQTSKQHKMRLLFALIFNLITLSTIGQIKKTAIISGSYNPVVIIDTCQTSFRALILDSSCINKTRKISLAAPSLSCLSYDIVIIEPKDNIKLVRINEVLDYFKIPIEDRKLKICINNILIDTPSKILANINDIKKVEITDYIYSPDPPPGNNQLKYINISI